MPTKCRCVTLLDTIPLSLRRDQLDEVEPFCMEHIEIDSHNDLRKVIRSFRQAYLQIVSKPEIKSVTNDYDVYWQSKKGGLTQEKIQCLNDFQRFRANWILQRIQQGSTVADIGCGDGAILKRLIEHKKIKPLGLDSSRASISHLQLNNIPSMHIDLSKNDSMDTVPEYDHFLLLEVLEHLPDPERVLNTLLNKVQVSLFFSVPNTGYFSYRLRLLLGRFPVQWRTHPGEHLRFWTYKDILWWLDELDLKDRATVELYEGIPILNGLFPGLFGAGIIVEIKKRSSDRKVLR